MTAKQPDKPATQHPPMRGPVQIDSAMSLILFQTWGELCYADWELQVRAALAATPGPVRRILSDRRGMSADYARGFLDGAVAFFRENPEKIGNSQWAILTRDKTAAHQTANKAMELAEANNLRVRVFTSLPPALDWLVGGIGGVAGPEDLERLTAWIGAGSRL